MYNHFTQIIQIPVYSKNDIKTTNNYYTNEQKHLEFFQIKISYSAQKLTNYE